MSRPSLSRSHSTAEYHERWHAQFAKATNGRDAMTLLQFMQCTACKSRFYAVKLFDRLDTGGSGTISFGEYCNFLHLIGSGSQEELAAFAFALFDSDQDGFICRAEVREALEASIQESESMMSLEEVNRLLEVLLRLFQADEHGRISRATFVQVLQLYPDILGNFTIGHESRHLASPVHNLSTRIAERKKRKMEEKWRWVTDNPKRAFGCTITLIVILGCFLWRFGRYAGSCDGVDLNLRDTFLNVTRQEVKNALEEAGVTMSVSDAKYMAFSLQMAGQDPIRCRDARKRRLLSWTLPLAKGCGQGMKATFTLILLPVSRTLMTKLRRTSLSLVFDFDNAISYHRMLGKIGFALAWSHALLHVVDVVRWRDTNLFKQWSFAFPKNLDKGFLNSSAIASMSETDLIQGVPAGLLRDPSEQPTYGVLLGSDFAITGIILLVTYSIAALFAFDYPKGLAIFKKKPGEREENMTMARRIVIRIGRILNNFNNFWYTHHLFAVFYLAMLFHPMPHLPDERHEWAWSDSWLWVLLPVAFYLMERVYRATQSSVQTQVIELRLLPGKVLALKTAKPEKLRYKAGQYVFINCPQIAPFEWHPFTLTSAPHDPYLGVHIRAAGDWTTAFYTAVRNYRSWASSRTNMEVVRTKQYPFNVRVAGPYGAPAQNYGDFGVVVLVGAGIGVTPFAAVLSDMLHAIQTQNARRLRKVYFHWTVRSREEASWFKTLLEEIVANDTEGILDINIHITALKEGNDLRVMLLRLAEFEDVDAEQGRGVTRANTHFGRPNWSIIMRTVRQQHMEEPTIGVFFCGPTALKRTLKAECVKQDGGTPPRFVFRKEVF